MLRATSHAHRIEAEPFGTLTLDSNDRHLRRKLVTTDQDVQVMVDLPAPVLLADGDALILEDGSAIRILAAVEKLYQVEAGRVPLRHLAWHIGNRHLAAQIDEDRILIRRDQVIRDMLEGLGATVQEVVEHFQPVHGAYHSHDHGHNHGHSHDSHSHSNDHSLDHGPHGHESAAHRHD